MNKTRITLMASALVLTIASAFVSKGNSKKSFTYYTKTGVQSITTNTDCSGAQVACILPGTTKKLYTAGLNVTVFQP